VNEKGGAGIVVFIIIAVIVFGAIVAVVFVATQKDYFKPKDSENNTKIKFIVQTRNIKTQESVKANYILYDLNNTKISEGIIEKDELREIMIEPSTVQMICWSEDYYLRKAIKEISVLNVEEGIATFSCDMDKIEKSPEIEYVGNLNNQINEIDLNFTVKDRFQKLSVCFSWTSGFTDVSIKDSFITCETGIWKNWTSYNGTTLTYNYLPEGEYLCGERIEACQVVQGNKCKSINEETPSRFRYLADSCYYLGKSPDDETITIPIVVEVGEYISRIDELKIMFYDKDRRWDTTEQRYLWTSEDLEGNDIASPDLTKTIIYEGGL